MNFMLGRRRFGKRYLRIWMATFIFAISMATVVFPMPIPVSPKNQLGEWSGNGCFANCSGDRSMSGQSTSENNDMRELVHPLTLAYENALAHDTPNPDPDVRDLLLESASIRLSSRIAYEVTQGACSLESPGGETDSACVLDDESIDLRSLTDMLSYAASRLENLARSSLQTEGKAGRRDLVAARIGSMQHLYRLVFALSRVYLDRSQSDVYVDAARHELRLARQHMENERSLCACGSGVYAAQLRELSHLDDTLKGMAGPTTRP
jgi:hypothetical protein